MVNILRGYVSTLRDNVGGGAGFNIHSAGKVRTTFHEYVEMNPDSRTVSQTMLAGCSSQSRWFGTTRDTHSGPEEPIARSLGPQEPRTLSSAPLGINL
jgi:hypothetical protein